MDDASTANGSKVPKLGMVNEICQEWMVREDGAMAYRLQNQEIKQHYIGNKQRNALVREDYPTAKTEQQKEQELAEQAAAVYRRMLEEQEEVDKMLAERLTQKLEFEERIRKKAEEREGFQVAKKLQEELEKPPVLRQFKPNKDLYQHSGNSVIDCRNVDCHTNNTRPTIDLTLPNHSSTFECDTQEELSYKSQEEADAELARILQEQEGNPEECILQRDRLLAIEAQDKELAKVLQERERIKAKKAKEKARQKALAKRQQKLQEQAVAQDVLLPDDAYSNPADMIVSPARANISQNSVNGAQQYYEEYEDNYSLPIDGLDNTRSHSQATMFDYPNCSSKKEQSPARPSHLNIKSTYKPRYPDPEEMSSKLHSNIAMAIDPTYVKQETSHSPGSYSSPSKSSSSKTSSKSSPSSSSSKEIMDIKLDANNAPPYMPIQGQKRTASLEKRRVRDGCKQQ
ncbi:hypothetical protein WA026_018398 [Henosepilachna vigintioctopunctata]|uniref:Coiled-coil domain-containing protein n=1 Tax=Henosepilachna vigintioctopunctata TaxID=420089 RepID=A0AAW1V0W4_9CUCU